MWMPIRVSCTALVCMYPSATDIGEGWPRSPLDITKSEMTASTPSSSLIFCDLKDRSTPDRGTDTMHFAPIREINGDAGEKGT